METKQLGTVIVDSGKLMIVDPMFLQEWEISPFSMHTEASEEFTHQNIIRGCSEKGFHQNNFDNGNKGLALTVACNDGEYPVMAELEDGIVRKIWVEF